MQYTALNPEFHLWTGDVIIAKSLEDIHNRDNDIFELIG